MRTYSRDTFEEARRSWLGFGWQWQHIRRIAAERGFIYAPTGTAHDDRDSPEPSQRAVIWRALEDNPAELERIVRRSRSWHEVVDGIFGLEARLGTAAYESERDAQWERDQHPDEGFRPIARMFDRIADSLGYVKREEHR